VEVDLGAPNFRRNLVLAFLHSGLAAKILSVAALLSAVALEWMLVNVPVSEVSAQFPPATVRARDEVVTFSRPAAVTGDSFLFVYAQGTESEKILLDAFFDRAQLSDTTVAALKSLQVVAPTTPAEIAHLTSNFGSGSCATKLRVEPAGGQVSGVELSQSGDAISSGYRALGVRFIGADALVTLTPQGAFEHGLSPCKVGLSVGDWKQATEGFLPIQIRVPAGEPFRFHWRNLSEHTTTWKTHSSAIALLSFGASGNDQFLADDIAIRSINPKNGKPEDPPSLEARGQKSAPLTVSFFGINQNQLEITASGRGRALRHGSVLRQNVLETVNKYPIPSALLGAGNLALIAWVKRAFWPSRSKD
jgi:hypothetical protein